MKLVGKKLTPKEINELITEFGKYIKVTVDITKNMLVVGCELHADGEKILLKSGSLQDNIWGGGINLQTKEIDATTVLNLRPRLSNSSLEILDPERRKKFIAVVAKLFKNL